MCCAGAEGARLCNPSLAAAGQQCATSPASVLTRAPACSLYCADSHLQADQPRPHQCGAAKDHRAAHSPPRAGQEEGRHGPSQASLHLLCTVIKHSSVLLREPWHNSSNFLSAILQVQLVAALDCLSKQQRLCSLCHLVLCRYHQLDPEHDGPLSGTELDRHFKQALCDKVQHRIGSESNPCAVLSGAETHVYSMSQCLVHHH